MADPFTDTRDPLVKTMERASRSAEWYRQQQKISRLRGTLVAAKQKLGFYRREHGGEYVGGVEYTELIRQIDEVLNETML
jgi:hypothetical protein